MPILSTKNVSFTLHCLADSLFRKSLPGRFGDTSLICFSKNIGDAVGEDDQPSDGSSVQAPVSGSIEKKCGASNWYWKSLRNKFTPNTSWPSLTVKCVIAGLAMLITSGIAVNQGEKALQWTRLQTLLWGCSPTAQKPDCWKWSQTPWYDENYGGNETFDSYQNISNGIWNIVTEMTKLTQELAVKLEQGRDLRQRHSMANWEVSDETLCGKSEDWEISKWTRLGETSRVCLGFIYCLGIYICVH